MIRTFRFLWLTICFFTAFAVKAGSYSQMIVFGDSLSDNGNLATLATLSPDLAEFQFLNNPPYAKAFTNGAPAVVKLAELLGVPALRPALFFIDPGLNPNPGTNFAVAGARVTGNRPIDLNTQMGAFLAGLQIQGINAPADALYVVFIGGNDIRDLRDAPDHQTLSAILQTAKKNIQTNLMLLIGAGARHIMVVNSPDIGKIPETKILADKQNNANLIDRASSLTKVYNQALANTVKKVEKATQVNIVLFDIFGVFDALVKDSPSFLFSNAKKACYSSVAFTYYPICNQSTIDSFIYFDEIHPTRRVHERVARAMFALIPEPF